MKKTLFALALIICLSSGVFAQESPRFMQITTIESVVGGGMGRSRMIITKEDGSQEEKELENLFSMTGINFKNIKSNESGILQTIKSYTDQGWKLFSTTPLTLSPGNNGSGIFMTRYLLVKDNGKSTSKP
ncbi:MAG TPA: hypothetical protein VD996_12820 [Chitinophagaceae bacterium]|nr:hypothetical protein [Chitinophagaceae bacterium]